MAKSKRRAASPARARAKTPSKGAPSVAVLPTRPTFIPLPHFPTGTSLCVGLHVPHQEQTQWCWAAVSLGVSKFYAAGSTWTQCKIANAELSQSTCCADGSTASCNQPWYLDRALTRVGRYDSMSGTTLPFATIKSLLSAGRPPCARQAWSGGGAHFMGIVCVYEGLSGLLSGAGSRAKRLKISDPWYGDSIVDYTTFVSGYQGTGSWTHSYRTKA